MKHYFKAVQTFTQDGKPFLDDDGAFHLVDHDHLALKGKEFNSIQEGIQAINDFKLMSADPKMILEAGKLAKTDPEAAIALLAALSEKTKIGEVIFLPVYEF